MHREWWPAGSMSVCRASTDKRLRRLAAYKNGYRRTDAMVRRTPLVLRNSIVVRRSGINRSFSDGPVARNCAIEPKRNGVN